MKTKTIEERFDERFLVNFSDCGRKNEIYYRLLKFIASEISQAQKEEYKKGYNQALKDNKLTGEKYQHKYL